MSEAPGTATQGGATVTGIPGWWSLIAAVQFLTRLPLCTSRTISAEDLRRSPVYFPLVGSLIGLSTAVVLHVAMWIWPLWIAVIVALVFEVLLTGAIHEDAVADVCDAFGGGWSREQVLTILKDSRVGTYGILGLGFAVVLRAFTTSTVMEAESPWLRYTSLVAAATTGRFAMVAAMWWALPAPGRQSLAQGVGCHFSCTDLIFAGLFALPGVALFAWIMPWHALLALCVVGIFEYSFLSYVKRRIGGTTGDCLGCLGYVSQVLVLLCATVQLLIVRSV